MAEIKQGGNEMQATGTFREAGFSKGFVLVVIAMACALLLGAAGGFAARNVSSSGGASVHAQSVVNAHQGGPQSDLTRALPTSAPADASAGYDVRPWQTSQPQPDFGPLP
jgi:hypothetical protein